MMRAPPLSLLVAVALAPACPAADDRLFPRMPRERITSHHVIKGADQATVALAIRRCGKVPRITVSG